MKVKKGKGKFLLAALPTVIAFLIVAVPVSIAALSVRDSSGEQAQKVAEDAVKRAIITCYAREGSYPPDIDYLKENYGLHISDDFTIHYTYIAGNLMPDLTIIKKQK